MLGAFRRGLGNLFLNRIDDGIGILPGGKDHLQFVPEPLAGRRKIKVMAFDCKTICEGHAASGRVSGVGPVAGFEQYGMKHSQLDDFSGHAVDLHPVTKPDSVFPHQHKPPDEAHDEIFQGNRQARAGEPEKRADLSRKPNDHQQNKENRGHLNGDAGHSAKRFQLPAVQ